MNILAVSGSLRAASANTSILRAIAAVLPEGISYSIWDGPGTLPHFSPDMDFDQSPDAVLSFRMLLQASDAVIICTPEYAFGMPGVLKNALDWVVSSGELNQKPVATISASPLPTGGSKAHAWLNQTLTALGARQMDEAKLSVAAVKGKLNAQGEVTDAPLLSDLRKLVDALVSVVEIPGPDAGFQ